MSLQQVEILGPQVDDPREREHRLFQEVTDAVRHIIVKCRTFGDGRGLHQGEPAGQEGIGLLSD